MPCDSDESASRRATEAAEVRLSILASGPFGPPWRAKTPRDGDGRPITYNPPEVADMSIATPRIRSGRPDPKRWTGAEFDQASALGLFAGQRLELVNGELLEMPPMNDPHAQAIQLANVALVPIFPMTTHTVRIQCPMRLGESRAPAGFHLDARTLP